MRLPSARHCTRESVGCRLAAGRDAIHRHSLRRLAPHQSHDPPSTVAAGHLGRRRSQGACDDRVGVKGRKFSNCNWTIAAPASAMRCRATAIAATIAVLDVGPGSPRHDAARRAPRRGVPRWPGPIRERQREGGQRHRRSAAPAQREALLRILRGEVTWPFATIFDVFASTCDRLHEPLLADIEFELDIAAARARAGSRASSSARRTQLNSVTGAEHRIRIVQPNGFEFAEAEIGRASRKPKGRSPMSCRHYGRFAEIHLCQNGIVRRDRERRGRGGADPSEDIVVGGGPRRALSARLTSLFDGAGTGMDPFAVGRVAATSVAAGDAPAWSFLLLAHGPFSCRQQ